MFRRAIVLVAALASLGGCARYSFDTYITVPKGRPTTPTPAEPSEQVQVFVERLPEGVRISDYELVVDPEKYEYLGVMNTPRNRTLLANFGFWPYEYDEGWRYAICTPQVPLSWVTLSIWAWLSPTYWPCHVSEGTEEERRATMVETMKRGTKLIGGNVLVVGGFGGYDFVKAGKDPNGMKESGKGSISGVGYALRAKNQEKK